MKNLLVIAFFLTSVQAFSQATGAGPSAVTLPGPVTNTVPTGMQPTPLDLRQRQEENPGLTGGVNSGFNPGPNNLPSSATPVAPHTTLPSSVGSPLGTGGYVP